MSGARLQRSAEKQPYFGSVLFFKHLLLLAVAVFILVPTTLSGTLLAQRAALNHEIASLEAQLAAASDESAARIDELSARLAAAQDELARLEQSGGADEPSAEPEPDPVPDPEVPDYTALYPELYAPAADLSSVDIDRSAYLTFDDGPSACTDRILAILDEYGVKATFFVVGVSDEVGLERMRSIVAAGHTLGVHSYTHKYQKIYASVEAYLDDFNLMYTQILEATGVAPTVFRFPGGSINGYNGKTYQPIITEMTRRGFVYFDWNAINGDATTNKLLPADTLAANALEGIGQRRAVILMHDASAKTTTVDALPAIIEGYQAAGYTFYPLTAETRPVTYGYY